MMNLHFATCPWWGSGDAAVCNCLPEINPAWRIRKDSDQQFPWRIYRRTGDRVYEPLMGCSSFDRALELVRSLHWLRRHGVRRPSDA